VLSRIVRFGAPVVASIALGACAGTLGAITPASGPFALDVVAGASPTVPYSLIKLTPQVAEALNEYEPAVLAGAFTDQKPPAPVLFGIGDTVSVTIFEAAAGGLFIPIEAGVRPGNFVQLPDQTVDNDGNISVPYAGVIKASRRTNVEIQNDVVARIRNRAIEPQVVVSLTRQNSSLISVFGEVNLPVRFAQAGIGAGDRITDAITRAGGIKGQGFETWVMLERKGRRATVPFANLVYQPQNNIYVQPADRIYVYREQQKFVVFGAAGVQGEFNFDAWRINLSEAVGKAGGLFDLQADPGQVFLYRREPKEVAKLLGVQNLDRFKEDTVPIIFQTSFRDPGGYFTATKVQMRHGDVIFIANSFSVESTKFTDYLNTLMGTASNGLALRLQVRQAMGKPN
jgi:polysaccharide export outer membrane protein